MKLVSPPLLIALGLFTACVAAAEEPANTNIELEINERQAMAEVQCAELPFLSCTPLRQLTPNPALTWTDEQEANQDKQRIFTERNWWPWLQVAERTPVGLDPFAVRDWQRVFE